MTYDNYGNITSKNGKLYSYGNNSWEDLLTAYGGKTISYDEQGNPINYMGTTLVWEKGRQLKSFGSAEFKYNANGIRIYKKANGVEHRYILDGTKILKETYGTNTIIPLYDNEESVCGIVYNGSTYYFMKNLQGDVIAITNAGGTVVARYSYDAWGKCTITSDTTTVNIATHNPYRYRSYYYDSETELYYLQSRYYDPETARFVNADEASLCIMNVATSVRCNMYNYCGNNPINEKDSCGYVSTVILMAFGALFGIILQYVIDVISNLIEGKKKYYVTRASLWDYVSAGLSGAVAVTGIGKMAAAFYSTLSSVTSSLINNNGVNVLDIILSAVIGAVSGFIGGSGANLKKVSGIVKVSKKVVKTTLSPKKLYMYTNKIKDATISTIKNALRFVLAAVAGAIGGEGKEIIKKVS